MSIRYCILKFTIGLTILVFKIKAVSISFFSDWIERKQNGPISPKIINELPPPTKQILVTEMLSKPKNPRDYQGREVNEHEQAPIVPSPNLVAETVEIKKTNNSAKKVMDMRAAKRRTEKKKTYKGSSVKKMLK